MTPERQKAINEWLSLHCRKCVYNEYRGTCGIKCQFVYEILLNVGMSCIHYEEYHEQEDEQ